MKRKDPHRNDGLTIHYTGETVIHQEKYVHLPPSRDDIEGIMKAYPPCNREDLKHIREWEKKHNL
jgi:hypothetical protein